MNDLKIYEQVAKKPRIGATEIANNLDMTLATVSADLRVLVDTGDLVKSTHFDEANGRQWQVYELSDDFKASRTYKAMIETMDPPPVVTTPAPAPAPAPPRTETVQQDAPRITKVQLAIDCITRLEGATDDQLRDAMGLPPKAYPGTYLAPAVKNGRVVRDGDRWKLGPGKVEAAPNVPDGVEKVENIVVATKDASPTPRAVIATTAPTPAAPRHRCAIWSDGTYELETDGIRAAILSHDQVVAFCTFIEKMGGSA